MNRRWIVVAGAPFVPAQDGGEREHLGFVEALLARGWLGGVVVPTDDDPARLGRTDDLNGLRELVAPAPVLLTPRRRSLGAALRLGTPYVVASRPAPKNLAARVGMQVPDATGVVVFAFKSRQPGQLIAEQLGLPAVLRHHNLEEAYHRALAGSLRPPKSWVVGLEARRVGAEESRLERARWLSGIADISLTDAMARQRRSLVPVAHVPTFALGPNRTAAVPMQPWQPPARPIVTFLGALHVGTNHDALEWFAAKVWPLVHEGNPTAVWRIVGRSPTKGVRDLVARTPRSELHADVADPGQWLRDSSLAVNPTVSGSGVNIKLVEYLSVGVPVVSTTKGMSGLGLTAGEDLAVADSPEDFAHAVLGLLADRDRSQRTGAAGRATAAQVLNVDRSLDTIAELMDSAGWTERTK